MSTNPIPVHVLDALDAVTSGAIARSQESETLEFKAEARDEGETIRILLDAAICLANSRGGTVVLGIDDQAEGPDAFLGTSLSTDLIRRRLHELSQPPLVVTAFEQELGDRRLVVLGVPEGMEMHSDTKGRSSRRIGAECRPLSISQAAALNDDRRRFDWSAEPSELGLEDVSGDAIDAVRLMLGRFDDERRALARASPDDLLGDLGVLRAGRLLRAGEVLFCAVHDRPPILYMHADSPGGEPGPAYRDDVAALTAYREVIRRIQQNASPTSLTLPDGQQLMLHDFPLIAVREALSNALLHRDYRQPESIVVEHSAHVLSFVSPGPLVPGVTRENILHTPSRPRNALLTKVARSLGLAEELSRGVDRMYREMLKLGKRPPEITEDAPFNVRVDLTGGAPNQTVARFVTSLPAAARDDVDVMLVLFMLLQLPAMRVGELASALQRSQSATEAVVQRMSDPSLDLIVPQDRRGGRAWRLSPRAVSELRTALRYRTVTHDEIDRKIIDWVRAKGRIDNKTLQIFFDLDVHGAAYRLRTLVNADVLQKLGQQKRGPGIQYGAGPKFPDARS